MIYKKRYRLLYNVAFVLVAMYVLFLISEFLLGVNTIFVTNFPNLLLVAFCMFSTDYYKRGLHHQVELVDDEKNINIYLFINICICNVIRYAQSNLACMPCEQSVTAYRH